MAWEGAQENHTARQGGSFFLGVVGSLPEQQDCVHQPCLPTLGRHTAVTFGGPGGQSDSDFCSTHPLEVLVSNNTLFGLWP